MSPIVPTPMFKVAPSATYRILLYWLWSFKAKNHKVSKMLRQTLMISNILGMRTMPPTIKSNGKL